MTITAEAMPILRDAGVDIEAAIHAGDRVTIRVRSGSSLRDGQEYREKTGRAVMRGSAGWVLNMGGQYGTPAIANAENIVYVGPKKGRRHETRSELR